MANALPQAIGAQLAFPRRQIMSMSGDGGLAMLLGELLTVRLHDLPVKVALFNNSSLGMVKLEMLVAGMPDFETDHRPVDFSAIARAAGIEAIRVENPRGSGMGSWRPRPQGTGADGIRTDPNALSMPPSITADQIKGFALAASKIVLDGGVGKMIEMARSNLRNIPRP